MADAGFDACRTFPARGSPASRSPPRSGMPSKVGWPNARSAGRH